MHVPPRRPRVTGACCSAGVHLLQPAREQRHRDAIAHGLDGGSQRQRGALHQHLGEDRIAQRRDGVVIPAVHHHVAGTPAYRRDGLVEVAGHHRHADVACRKRGDVHCLGQALGGGAQERGVRPQNAVQNVCARTLVKHRDADAVDAIVVQGDGLVPCGDEGGGTAMGLPQRHREDARRHGGSHGCLIPRTGFTGGAAVGAVFTQSQHRHAIHQAVASAVRWASSRG